MTSSHAHLLSQPRGLRTLLCAVAGAGCMAAFPDVASAALIIPQGQGHGYAVGQVVPDLRPALSPQPCAATTGGDCRRAPTPMPSRVGPRLLRQIVAASELQGLDPYLVKAVVRTESNFTPTAVSPKRAIGLMQVLPSTAAELGLKPREHASVEQLLRDPWVSLLVGTRYLAQQLERFGRVDLALAAYNAGPTAVEKAGLQVPRIAETQAYVRQVLGHYRQMRREGTLAAVLRAEGEHT